MSGGAGARAEGVRKPAASAQASDPAGAIITQGDESRGRPARAGVAAAAPAGEKATGAQRAAPGGAVPLPTGESTESARRGRRRTGAGAGLVALLAAWWLAVEALDPPAYVFPSPVDVARVLVADWAMLLRNAAITGLEMVLGLALGTAAGIATALAIAATPLVRRLVLPAVVVTQTLPVFAIAPLLVVWLGYGLTSKIVMAALIIYFPVATAYAEAMMRVDRRLVDLARLQGAGRLSILWLIRAPGGLPGLVAGLKVAATVAPIGAVVGEWVGASAGLGYVMLHANARLQTDTLFAALFLLAVLALLLRRAVDAMADRLVPWQPAD